MRLSKETKIQIVLNFNKFDSPIRLQRYLKSLHHKEVTSRASIQNIIKKFKETGSNAELPRPGGTKKRNLGHL